MENSVDNKKAENSFLPNEFKKIINLHSDDIAGYFQDAYYFQDVEEKINDKNMKSLALLKYGYHDLATEFRNSMLKYNIIHNEIAESVLDKIIKINIDYILHEKRRDGIEDLDSDDESDNDEELIDNNDIKKLSNNYLKEQKPKTNNDLKEQEPKTNNNIKELQPIIKNTNLTMISNILQQSINDNYKESLINDTL